MNCKSRLTPDNIGLCVQSLKEEGYKMIKQPSIPIIDLIKCSYYTMSVTKKINYFIIPAYPAAGVFFVTPNSPHFLQGRVSMRGKKVEDIRTTIRR